MPPVVSTTSRAREIFHAALDRSQPDQWPSFLDSACQGDATLRQQVERLLLAHNELHSFMEQPAAGPPATLDQPAERLGAMIGPYKLLEQIGEGGMGLVYMAEQQQPVRRLVALKIIKPGMDSKQVIARFEAERQALAMMDHQSIAKVLDAGTTDVGRPYFVMELVRGIPLNDFCEQQKLTLRQRLELFMQVCQAVQHAHQKGIIHRDLKPTNVLVAKADTIPLPKVIDFGIAKALGASLTDRTLHTGFAQLVGTPMYMSPEQAEMNHFGVDTRSDVYSLGVLLYELLTGTTPFDKDRLKSANFDELRRIIREEEPETVSARIAKTRRVGQVPARRGAGPPNHDVEPAFNPKSKIQNLKSFAELDWIVMKALEKDRSRRYESASAFAADIQRYLTGDPVLAHPPTTMYRFQKFARKHQPALVTAAAIALCLLLGTTVSAWQAVRATTAEAEANANEKKAVANAVTAQEKEQEAIKQRDEVNTLNDKLAAKEQHLQRTLYAANMSLAQNAWDVGGIERVNALLDQLRPVPGENDLRGFEWHYLRRLSQVRPLLTLSQQPRAGLVEHLNYTPDGTRLLGFFSGGKLNVWDALNGRELISHNLAGAGRAAVFSPDGRLVASAVRDQAVKVWEIQTGRELFSLKDTGGGGVAFSRDGRRFATTGGEWDETKKAYVAGHVRVWDSQTGQEVHNFPGHTNFVASVAFSPDGKRLASGSNRTIKVWDIQTQRELRSLPAINEWVVRELVFNSDGSRLTSDGYSRRQNETVFEAQLWDLHTGQELLALKGGHTMHFSPDGKRLIAAGWDKSRIRVFDAQTGKIIYVVNNGSGRLAVSPDSRWLAARSDGTLQIWDLQTGEEIRTLKGVNADRHLAFSPDGKRLVGGRGTAIQIWDAEKDQDEEQTIVFKGIDRQATPRYGSSAAAFSPDFSRLAGISKKSVIVFGVPDGQEILTLRGHDNNVICVAYSPDGKYLASGDGRQYRLSTESQLVAGVVKLWDAQTGKELHTLQGHKSYLYGLAFSPDGKRLASISDDLTVKLWDAENGQEIRSFAVMGAQPVIWGNVAFSPDGKRLASATGAQVQLWDAQTGQELLTLRGGASAFSPDGKRLVTFGGRIRVYDAQTGQELYTILGNSFNVAFSPDGERLAGPAKVWDAQTGQELLSLKGDTSGSVSFSPDGHRLASISAFGGVGTFYDATPLPEKPR